MKDKTKNYICKSCGGEGSVQYGIPCSTCGNRHLVFKVEKGEYKIAGYPIGITVEGDPSNPLGRRIESRPRTGGAADSYIGDDGCFRINLSNPINNSDENEPQVRKILINKLRELGHDVQPVDGASDSRGEDGKLEIDGDEFDLQIVTSLNQNFWEDLSINNEATLSGGKDKAVSLLHKAIDKKSKLYEKSVKEKMILALDLSYSGALVHQSSINAYIDSYGDPQKKCLFKSVWLVGPTTRSTMPLSPF